MVTLEMVKFFQGIIISKDENMHSKVSKCYTAVQSSNLNEELGQIHHIFSDKTGKLRVHFQFSQRKKYVKNEK
jgi:phospholipid-transporting ATPase